SYALITGASDGIGRALALEFAKWGFNIILHGRNPPKLAKVREEILALQKEKEKKKGKGKDVLLWVQDAAEDVDWPAVRKRFEQLEITVLVNNVGGSKLQTLSFDQQPLADVTRTVHINALFPFWLTHTLLPLLRQPYPTLLLNVGSMAGVIPPPHFAAYAGSKAFLDRFTHALDLDERISGSQVKVHYLQTATVLNSSGVMRRSLTVPSAEEYARGAVRVVGGTRRVVFPYWMHGLQ
ncbi:NADP-binding protein, partial [Dacryopinax primogenitus]